MKNNHVNLYCGLVQKFLFLAVSMENKNTSNTETISEAKITVYKTSQLACWMMSRVDFATIAPSRFTNLIDPLKSDWPQCDKWYQSTLLNN